MEYILDIIGFACFGHMAVEFFTHMGFTQKPFGCNLCLSFWVSLFPLVIMYGNYGFLLAAITGVTSEAIYKLLMRL